MNLADITSISTGLTMRERPKPSPEGAYLLLQLGDIGIDGGIIESSATPVDGDSSYEKFVLIPGDLVFRGRGAAIAVAVVGASQQKLVAAAPLIIIRPDATKVNTNYLAWFLRSRPAQKHFAQHMSGSIIKGIGKRDLECLQVTLPDMSTQRKIGDLVRLQEREQELAKASLFARKDFINRKIEGIIDHQKSAKKAGVK